MVLSSTTKPGAWLVRLALLAALALASGVTPSVAQLAVQGATTVLRSGVVRGVDASFDPNTNTYMVVGAQDSVFAVCTNAAGAATSSVITIKPPNGDASNKPFGSMPRVRYSQDLNGGAGAFMVIWQQEEVTGAPQLHTRVVSCSAGLLGTEQVISTGAAPWTDFGASALDYSATSRTFLVAWKAWVGTGWRMVARFIDLSGAGVGPIVTLSTGFGRDPGVAWNPFLNEFGVSFSGESADGRDGYSVFVRVPATNIEGFSRTTFNQVPGCMTTATDLAFNPSTRRYVMAWWQGCGAATKVAEFSEAGTLETMGLVSSTLGSYDALSLAYNPASGTFGLLGIERVYDHAMATELNSHGYKFSSEIRVESDPPPGTFYTPVRYPRIASQAAEKSWLAALNVGSFVKTASQILVTSSSNGGPAGSYPPPGSSSCTYSLNPTSGTEPATGGTGSFTVTTTSGCAWTATTTAAWVHITSGTSGSASGTVIYTADANSGAPRSATITAGGQSYTVNQPGTCGYTLSPTSSGTIAAAGATGSFAVITTAGCTWTASTTANWVHVTSGSGTASGAVAYSVDANAGTARTGTIAVAGQSFTVTQSEYVAPPPPPPPPGCTAVTVQAKPTAPPGVGGVEILWQSSGVFLTAGQPVTLTASGSWSDAGVALTAAGHPTTTVTGVNCPLSGQRLLALIGRVGLNGTPFLVGTSTTFTPSTGGILYLAPQDNWYTIWDNAGSLNVLVCVDASSCSYSVNPTSSAVSSAGGSGSFSVSTGTGCSWSAATTASWIHVTSGSGTSSGTVSFTVDPDVSDARTGTITVGGQTHTVTQAGITAGTYGSITVLAKPTPPPGVGGVETLWQSTGISVMADRPLAVVAAGTWSNAGATMTAAGDSSITVEGVNCPLSGAPLLALIGRIGSTGAPFVVGEAKTWIPTTSGTLYLAPQDNWYTTWDNAGSLSVSVNQDTSGCTYALDPTSSGTVAASGGNGSFTVTTGGSCTWTPATASSWIHITSGSGPGSATVAYTVDVNPATARTGSITVGDQVYTVSQAANAGATCTNVTVTAKPVPPPGVGGVETLWQSTGVTVTAGQPLVVSASGVWTDAGVTLTAAGHPTQTVTGTNCPLSGAPLLALIGRIGPTGTPFLIGASKAWTPSTSGVLYLAPQDNWYTTWDNSGSLSVSICPNAGGGCSYSLNPDSGTVAATGGTGSFVVTTGTGCAWSAATADSWIHLTSGSGTSSGTVTYAVDVNAGQARTGSITVGGQTFTVSQAANASQGCDTFTVLAKPPLPAGVGGVETLWQTTGISLTAGQPVTVTTAGSWTDAGITLTGDGNPLVTVTGPNCPLSGQPVLALIGRIGATGTPFLVGATRTFTPTTSGVLYLAPQDNWYTTWDNTGSLSVTICR